MVSPMSASVMTPMMTPGPGLMETKSLTYDELGQALGITPASAKRLAIRRKWPKAPGNDGRTRVTVPLERLENPKRPANDDTSDITADDTSADTREVSGDITQVVNILSQHIAKLEQELGEVRDRASDRDILEGQLEGLKTVLEVERRRSEELRVERDRLLDRLMAQPEPRAGLLDRLRKAFG
jgi:hypothetical protein